MTEKNSVPIVEVLKRLNEPSSEKNNSIASRSTSTSIENSPIETITMAVTRIFSSIARRLAIFWHTQIRDRIGRLVWYFVRYRSFDQLVETFPAPDSILIDGDIDEQVYNIVKELFDEKLADQIDKMLEKKFGEDDFAETIHEIVDNIDFDDKIQEIVDNLEFSIEVTTSPRHRRTWNR